MAEERMRATVVFGYSIDPLDYPETSSPAERAEADQKSFLDDPGCLADMFNFSHGSWKVTITPMSVTSPEGKTT